LKKKKKERKQKNRKIRYTVLTVLTNVKGKGPSRGLAFYSGLKSTVKINTLKTQVFLRNAAQLPNWFVIIMNIEDIYIS